MSEKQQSGLRSLLSDRERAGYENMGLSYYLTVNPAYKSAHKFFMTNAQIVFNDKKKTVWTSVGFGKTGSWFMPECSIERVGSQGILHQSIKRVAFLNAWNSTSAKLGESKFIETPLIVDSENLEMLDEYSTKVGTDPGIDFVQGAVKISTHLLKSPRDILASDNEPVSFEVFCVERNRDFDK